MSWAFDRCQQRYDNAIPEDRFDVFSEDDEPEREPDLDMDEDWHG